MLDIQEMESSVHVCSRLLILLAVYSYADKIFHCTAICANCTGPHLCVVPNVCACPTEWIGDDCTG